MKRIGIFFVMCCLIYAMGSSEARAQQQTTSAPSTSSAAATAVTASSGGPSSIQIRQQFFDQEQAYLQRQLREVQRCLTTSSLNVILYDPTGNVNRVPQTDLVNCRRRLEQLTRQANSLARRVQHLAQDAQAQSIALQRTAEGQRTIQNLRALRSAGGQ
jgi:hypothetical protein